jgi:signal transduction histidine kinase
VILARSLRSRLFLAIGLIVALSVAVTLGLGLLLTRRAVQEATLKDLAHQAALIVGEEKSALSPLTHLPELRPYLANQHERYLLDPAVLPARAQDDLAAGRSATGTVHVGGTGYYFAAEPVGRRAFILLRPRSLTHSRWTPFVESILIAALVGGALAAAAAFLLARRIVRPVARVAEASRSLASGMHPDRVPAEGAAELATLAESFNELAEQLARAREAERSFLLSASHELKTPLTAVAGYAEALREGAVGPDEAAEIISVEAERLERLVGDLLDLARLDQRTFSITAAPVDLGAAATQAVAAHAAQARELGVRLEADVRGAAGATADADRVGQILANLVENALRCTPEGGSVRVSAAAGRLEVADTGPGLAADDLPHAFERFYLHDRYGSDRQVGTGLGLAIVKQLAGAMDGAVAVASEPGAGTTFTVTLPPEGAA